MVIRRIFLGVIVSEIGNSVLEKKKIKYKFHSKILAMSQETKNFQEFI